MNIQHLRYFLLGRYFRFLIAVACMFTGVSCTPIAWESIDSLHPPTISLASPTLPPISFTSTPVISDFREKLISGTYLVYWSRRTWHIKGINDGTELQIPNIGSQINTILQLSPDGNLLAFSSEPGKISIYDLRTEALVSFSNPDISDIFEIQWAKDGKSLFYLGTPENIWLPDAKVGLFGISLNEKKVQTIIQMQDNRFKFGIKGLALSNDNRWLAFFAPQQSEYMATNPNYYVYLMDLTCLANILDCSEKIISIGDGYAPTWSMDGKLGWICYQNLRNALCEANVENQSPSPQIILTIDQLTISEQARFSSFFYSPNGKYIAINLQKYRSTNPNDITREMWLTPTGSIQPTIVSSEVDKLNESWKGWSPNSQYLVYERILGYSETEPKLGVRFAITNIYIYDVQKKQKITINNSPEIREVFNGFMMIK